MNVHLSLKSSNAKTGPIPVSVSSSDTCPEACPFRKAGCYAKYGPLDWHWKRVTSGERNIGWKAFLSAIRSLPIGQLWRHNQAGDLPGKGNRLDVSKLRQLVKASTGKRGFTYTHKPLSRPIERMEVRRANASGFTVNLSANSPSHADTLVDMDVGPVVCVIPSNSGPVTYTPSGRKIVTCPAQREGSKVTCATCQLCSRQRSVIVGFLPHGTFSSAVDKISKQN